jgi:aminomethyltransferase
MDGFVTPDLRSAYAQAGAEFAPDGIPLHFGDQIGEYRAALEGAVVFDRSHEGRIDIAGRDRFDLLNRLSTNDMTSLAPGQGRPTIFTNPNGRVLDRIVVYNWTAETVLALTGPGRTGPVGNYLQGNIFFNDDVTLTSHLGTHHQFGLHGPNADAVVEALVPGAAGVDEMGCMLHNGVFAARAKTLAGSAWHVIVPKADALRTWQALREAGARPSGGMIYNVLRIRAGRPGTGFELNDRFIPLELGLWDEVSFTKGCYTGQEIIARMESRGQLAKTLVRLELADPLPPGTDLVSEGRRVGSVTSSVRSPEGDVFAIGVVKPAHADPDVHLSARDADVDVRILERLGVQPAP